MRVTVVDLLRLALLMMAIGTISLSVPLVYHYRHSERLAHVLPLAVAYIWISVVVTLRGWDVLGFEAALWNCIGAYTVGNIGMALLLLRRQA